MYFILGLLGDSDIMAAFSFQACDIYSAVHDTLAVIAVSAIVCAPSRSKLPTSPSSVNVFLKFSPLSMKINEEYRGNFCHNHNLNIILRLLRFKLIALGQYRSGFRLLN